MKKTILTVGLGCGGADSVWRGAAFAQVRPICG